MKIIIFSVRPHFRTTLGQGRSYGHRRRSADYAYGWMTSLAPHWSILGGKFRHFKKVSRPWSTAQNRKGRCWLQPLPGSSWDVYIDVQRCQHIILHVDMDVWLSFADILQLHLVYDIKEAAKAIIVRLSSNQPSFLITIVVFWIQGLWPFRLLCLTHFRYLDVRLCSMWKRSR